jgi:5'-nucleotidase
MLEAGFRGDGSSQGYFPQVAGFRVCVDRSRDDRSRIVSLQVPGDSGWDEIDPEAQYTVVLPDFYRGGDGYQVPAGRVGSRTGAELKYLVLNAILAAQAQGKTVGIPVDENARRIELSDAAIDHCF